MVAVFCCDSQPVNTFKTPQSSENINKFRLHSADNWFCSGSVSRIRVVHCLKSVWEGGYSISLKCLTQETRPETTLTCRIEKFRSRAAMASKNFWKCHSNPAEVNS